MKFLAIFAIFTCSLCLDVGRIYFPDEIREETTQTPKPQLSTAESALRENFEHEEVSAPNVGRDFLQENFEHEEVSAPNVGRDFSCGLPTTRGIFYAKLSNNNTEVHMYYLNKTAENLASEGFEINILDVQSDVLSNFTFSNGSFTDTIWYKQVLANAPVGGKPASLIRAYYMAQLGEKIGDKIIWLCDGVLINRQWIISSAHCFESPSVNINLVRLGEYNISQPVDDGFNIRGKYIEDYSIDQIVPFPEFKIKQRYHDFVLIKLSRRTPQYSANIIPICLPWGNLTNLNLVGSEVVLTGWGATEYGGSKTEVLQEVDLKVFNTSVCNKAYSEVRDNFKKYPEGLTDDTILCIGWKEDGKDACKGDSGAPVVYQEGGDIHGDFILAGIVSGGYGCGLKEYPGLYIPINKSKYLRWIKEIAFKEYN